MLSAGIDIGTNTTRLIITEIFDNKIEKIIYQDRKITRLGEEFINTGLLKQEAIERTAAVVKEFYDKILEFDIKNTKIYATSAVREAVNGSDFINMLADYGIKIEIISGETEGKLTFLGVQAGGCLNRDEKAVIVDVGGGSTEFVLYDEKLIFSNSVRIGVVKLSDIFDYKSTVSKIVLEETMKYIDTVLSEAVSMIAPSSYVLIATAGTPTTLAAIDLGMEEYDYRAVNGYILKKESIENILKRLCALSIEERLSVKGLEKGREDLIIPGGMILLYIMEKLNVNSIRVSDFGLREGIAIDAANNN